MKHKHADLIKAWADGAMIEAFCILSNKWVQPIGGPSWTPTTKYRIQAPDPKSPQVALLFNYIYRTSFVTNYPYPTMDALLNKVDSDTYLFLGWVDNNGQVTLAPKSKPRKHADLIKAWADGAMIEFRHGNTWEPIPAEEYYWLDSLQYRLKPKGYQVLYRSNIYDTLYLTQKLYNSVDEFLEADSQNAEFIAFVDKDGKPLNLPTPG